MSHKSLMRGLIVLNVLLVAAVLLFLGREVLLAQNSPLAETPQLISYQGALSDDGGNPIEGTRDLTVAVFAVEEGGEPLWQETHTDVAFDGGSFSILLGSQTALPEDLFDDAERWLEMTVDDTTLSPRQQFTSVPYALNADKIDGLDSGELAALPSGAVVDVPTTTAPAGFSPIEGAMGEDVGPWLPLPPMPEGQQQGVLCDAYGDGKVFCWNAESGVSPVGAYYDDAQNTWHAMSTTGAPSARVDRTAVWAGDRYIVWGGHDGTDNLDSGARYDPETDMWAPTSATGAPEARREHGAVSLGDRMMVWGGYTETVGDMVNTGGVYDPVADTWQAVSTDGAPSPRRSPNLIWTGSRVIVWGGKDYMGTPIEDEALYDPATDSWSSMSQPPISTSTSGVAWTGSELWVKGLGHYRWLLYDPANDTWRQMYVPSPIVNSHELLAAGDLWLNVQGGYDTVAGRFFFSREDFAASAPWRSKTTFWTGGRLISFPAVVGPYIEGEMRSHIPQIVYPYVKE